MSGIKRNLVIAYVFLVVLPLLGLAGVLKSGRNLSAPLSIDGLWNFTVDTDQLSSPSCAVVLATIPDKAIVVSQSGKTFLMNFPARPDITASGSLEGSSLRASVTSPSASNEAGCAGAHQLTLLAAIERRANSSSMSGAFSQPDCPSCAVIGFRAERHANVASKNSR